jgi:hypothetical protein
MLQLNTFKMFCLVPFTPHCIFVWSKQTSFKTIPLILQLLQALKRFSLCEFAAARSAVNNDDGGDYKDQN